MKLSDVKEFCKKNKKKLIGIAVTTLATTGSAIAVGKIRRSNLEISTENRTEASGWCIGTAPQIKEVSVGVYKPHKKTKLLNIWIEGEKVVHSMKLEDAKKFSENLAEAIQTVENYTEPTTP